ncbi:MAG TPA: hypothetical protein VIV54_16760 [Burkholderiales bacterium]
MWRTLPFLLMLAACGPQWVRDDVSAEQADRDQLDCQREAQREATLRADGFYGSTYRAWSRAQGPAAMSPTGYRMMDEARLAEFCMRAKGYRPQPTN